MDEHATPQSLDSRFPPLESESPYPQLFDASPFPAVVSRVQDHAVLAINARTSEVIGIPQRDAVGLRVTDFYIDPSERFQLVEQLARNGRADNLRLRIKRANGEPFWVLASSRLVTWQSEPAVLTVFHDISEQLAAEDTKEREIYARMERQIPLWKDAVKRGVKVAFGTDQSHRLLVGENLVELRFMVDWLGMSPMQALVSATSRAAECIGRGDVGLLQPGRYADVLVVEGDPLADIRILEERARLKLVMQGGRAHTNTLT